jgi:nucleotidyltransferase/DNA polymerase involved in DNA repair
MQKLRFIFKDTSSIYRIEQVDLEHLIFQVSRNEKMIAILEKSKDWQSVVCSSLSWAEIRTIGRFIEGELNSMQLLIEEVRQLIISNGG